VRVHLDNQLLSINLDYPLRPFLLLVQMALGGHAGGYNADHLLGGSDSLPGPYGSAAPVFSASAHTAESIARSAATAVLANSSNPQQLVQSATTISKALQFHSEGLPEDLQRKIAAAASDLQRDVKSSLSVADTRDKCLQHIRDFEERNIYPKQLPPFKLRYDSPELLTPCAPELRTMTVAIPDSATIKEAKKLSTKRTRFTSRNSTLQSIITD
jgi:hypothetical protein